MPVGQVIPGLQRTQFGPFAGGVIDTKNPLLNQNGALADAENLYILGANSLRCRKGSMAAMTFQDDQGTPANVTSLRAVGPFTDRALILAHSTVTNKTYGYITASDFSGWYNASNALQSNRTAQPTFVLWTSQTTPPDVTVAEGLGIAFIAHTAAADASGLNWASYRVMLKAGTWDASTLHSDLDANGTVETLFFAGCIAFQQHLWAWGFGSGTTAATGFDPSKARWSNPIFAQNTDDRDYFNSVNSITLGDRVDSLRERITAGGASFGSLFLFSLSMASRVTGDGTDTWEKDQIDKTYGIVGPKAWCAAGDYVYYWSNRGPMRLNGNLAASPYIIVHPEPLWDGIPQTAINALAGGNPAGIVLGFDRANDQVQFFYQASATEGLVRFASWDHRREIWLGPDAVMGVAVACAGSVEPVYSVASPPGPPAGPPTLITSIALGTNEMEIDWTPGDTAAQTVVQYRKHGDTDWITAATVDVGVTGFDVTGLFANTAYDAQVYHVKNGQASSLATESPYATTLEPTALNPTDTTLIQLIPAHSYSPSGQVTWTNHQPGAQTEVWIFGPSATETSGDPAPGMVFLGAAAPGATSFNIGPVAVTGTYWVQTRAVGSSLEPSSYNPATPASAQLLAFNEDRGLG